MLDSLPNLGLTSQGTTYNLNVYNIRMEDSGETRVLLADSTYEGSDEPGEFWQAESLCRRRQGATP